MIKNYLLDTNVLLNNPQNIYGFEDNNVYICGTTLQELDSKKSFNGELGYNARECCRILDYLREKGDLIKGVKLENGGTLFVEPGGIDSSLLPKGYNLDVPDNRIISTCLYLNKSKLKDSPIILLTNDISMRVNATICGLKVQGVKNDIVEDSHYTGHIDIDVYPDAISEIYKNGSIPANSVNVQHFLENQFVTLNYDNKSALSVYQNGQLINIKEKTLFGGIRPLNKMQIYAIWALTNPDIPLVLIDGPAGCVDSKTEFFNGNEWKSIADYIEGEKVLQFDTKTNKAELIVPNDYIKLPCDKMYHFETKYGLDQTLSAEHRVIYYNKATHHPGFNGPYEITMEELYKKQTTTGFNGYFKTTFEYSGNGIELTDLEIKLMCAVICDGTFNKNNQNSKRCTINIKKNRKIERIRNLLNKMEIEYRETPMANGYVRFMFDAPRREKEFNSYWYNCTRHQLQIICDNVLFWDGCENKAGRKTFSAANKNTIDFVQFAFAACGQRMSVKKGHLKGTTRIVNGKEYTRKNDMYNGSISNRTMHGFRVYKPYGNTEINIVPSTDGYKYCFNVPTHALVLRRNGKIFITGNSSKTFLSLAAGLSQVYLGQGRRTDSQYHHLLISRPNTQNSDPGFGFLPGQLDEKMAPLIASYKDNLEAILRNKAKDEDDEQIKMQMDNLLDETIELCPLNYIRGRSLHDSYIICDEAQNSNKLLIRDVITRAGRGSKIVVAGDPRQCDVATLDSRNNGLVYAIEHMKGSKTTAIITFEKKHCVRSILAEEAIARMP